MSLRGHILTTQIMRTRIRMNITYTSETHATFSTLLLLKVSLFTFIEWRRWRPRLQLILLLNLRSPLIIHINGEILVGTCVPTREAKIIKYCCKNWAVDGCCLWKQNYGEKLIPQLLSKKWSSDCYIFKLWKQLIGSWNWKKWSNAPMCWDRWELRNFFLAELRWRINQSNLW